MGRKPTGTGYSTEIIIIFDTIDFGMIIALIMFGQN